MNRPVISPNLPAGFLEGDMRIEFFTEGTTTWAQQNGVKVRIQDAAAEIKNIILADMASRPSAIKALVNAGITEHTEQLIQYTRCCFGGYDGQADVVDGDVIHAEYWDCGNRGTCQYEGTLCCSILVGDQKISRREIEMIGFICTGLPDKQIAEKMGIEESTINVMKRRLCEKIGGHTKLDIMNFAIRRQIFNAK